MFVCAFVIKYVYIHLSVHVIYIHISHSVGLDNTQLYGTLSDYVMYIVELQWRSVPVPALGDACRKCRMFAYVHGRYVRCVHVCICESLCE